MNRTLLLACLVCLCTGATAQQVTSPDGKVESVEISRKRVSSKSVLDFKLIPSGGFTMKIKKLS